MHWEAALAVAATMLALQGYVACRSGHISVSHEGARFSCDGTKKRSFKVPSEIQCIHKCARETICELVNYNSQPAGSGDKDNCEIYHLENGHRSCALLGGEKGWKALVFWDAKICHYPRRHYCFPCECQGICSADGACSCNLVQLPDLLIAFETMQGNVNITYERGVDETGKDSVALVGHASIQPSTRRGGSILNLPNKQSSAVIGDFQGNPLNNPRNKKFTLSLWVKVTDAALTNCTIIASGRSNVDTGLNIIVDNKAQVLSAEVIAFDRFVSLRHQVGNTLQTWTHLAVTQLGIATKLFVNGVLVDSTDITHSSSAKTGMFKTLEVGTHSADLFPISGEGCGIQVDDIAVWYNQLSDQQVKELVSRGGMPIRLLGLPDAEFG